MFLLKIEKPPNSCQYKYFDRMLLPLLLQITLARANVDNNEHSNTCTHAHVEFMVVSRIKQSFSFHSVHYNSFHCYQFISHLFCVFFCTKKRRFFHVPTEFSKYFEHNKKKFTNTNTLIANLFWIKEEKNNKFALKFTKFVKCFFFNFGLCSEM